VALKPPTIEAPEYWYIVVTTIIEVLLMQALSIKQWVNDINKAAGGGRRRDLLTYTAH